MTTNSQAHPGKYLTFQLGRELYGISIDHVREINQMIDITPVPNTPTHIKGVINLRGKIVPVVNLRTKFRMPELDYDKETCIIVLEDTTKHFGVIVDKVQDVLDLNANEIESSPDLGHAKNEKYILGVGKKSDRILILVDIFTALKEEELTHIDEEQKKLAA